MIIWELIGDCTQRAAVFGGWLVKEVEPVYEDLGQDRGFHNGYNLRPAMAFVPDPDHEWDFTKDYSANTVRRTSRGTF